MPLQFSHEEYGARKERLLALIEARGLDGLLLFRQESMYWLSGYDSLGYIFFQCLYVSVDGRLVLFSRPQDFEQARHTSVIEDIVLWTDRENASAPDTLCEMLRERGCAGVRLGVEWDAHGFTASKAKALERALDGFCRTEDASDAVSRLRAIKSQAELDCMRKAARLADTAFDSVASIVAPGCFDGDLLATMHGTIFRGGGGYPANECILNSGPESVLVRHHAGRRLLEPGDPVLIELAAPFKRYHAGLLRTLVAGKISPAQRDMARACKDALATAEAALRPGVTLGEVFDRQAAVLDRAGFTDKRLHSCGYGLGASFPPTWVDWPMIHTGSQVVVEPNMTLLLLMILLDHENSCGIGFGHTVMISEHSAERLSVAPLDL